MDPVDFYDQLAPYYHLIYPDWQASCERQGRILDATIRATFGASVRSVLDLSCGIGTQAIGLALRGYRVTASDISEREVERAREEASARGLSMPCSVADMRLAHQHHQAQFDIVLCADNSLPHLLSEREMLDAVRQFHACTAVGGGCIITVRDYEREDRRPSTVRCYGRHQEAGTRFMLLQTWDFTGDIYQVTMYGIEHPGDAPPRVFSVTTSYYAIPLPRLMEVMRQAGFVDVAVVASDYHQPVVVGHRR